MNDTPPPSINETIVERFESAWLRGDPEPIERLTLDRSDPCYLATLEELVHLELEFAWKTDAEVASNSASAAEGPIPSRPRIEHYFARFPELNVRDIALRLVQQEYRVRCRFGDRPSQQEYRDRFPAIVRPGDEIAFRHPAESQHHAESKESDLRPGQEIGRYVLIDEAGRGGFGQVWQVEDTRLGRRIALKQMSERVAREEDLRRRFIAEARISAGLEHPGVVPVYDLDQLDEHHPYYTMKLVKGETLDAAIAHFHKTSVTPPTTSRSLEFQKLLGVFVSICRTIEYAHAHNVIHRDLKPPNIILGDYGETIVLDWGLAKVFRPEAESARKEAASAIIADWDTGQTQQGSVQGTPAYMSPEQADGRTDLVGPRTDIYALGVILYQLLAGVLPFEGNSVIEVLQKVQEGRFSPPRSVNRVVPKALEAVCLKAMARHPENRYGLVQELREDIERYLADEAVSVHREPWFGRLRRWGRRHRTFVTGAIATTVVLLISLVTSVVLLADAAKRERVIADRERAARMLAEEMERAANQARQQAVQERDRANENLALAASAVFQFQDGITNTPILQSYGFSDFRRGMLDQASKFYETLLQKGSKDSRLLEFRATSEARLGDIELMTGRYDSAEAAYRAAIDAFAFLIESEPQSPGYRKNLAVCQDHLGRAYILSGEPTQAETLLDHAFQIRQGLAVEFPDDCVYQNDLAESLASLAILAGKKGDTGKAETLTKQEIDTRKRVVAISASREYQYRLAYALKNRGKSCLNQGNYLQARDDLQAALRIMIEIGCDDIDPQSQETMSDVLLHCGLFYQQVGELELSEQSFDSAIDVAGRLAIRRPDVPNYVKAFAIFRKERALLYIKTKRFQDAEKESRGITEYLSSSAAAFPGQAATFQSEIALITMELGRAYAVGDRWNDAEQAFQRAAEIYQGLVSENPDDPSYQVAQVRFWFEVGCLYLEQKRFEAAETHICEAQVLAESHRKHFPKDDAARAALADIYPALARVRFMQGNSESAERAYTTALEFCRSWLETAPDPIVLQNRIAGIQHNLWVVCQQNCRFTQAKTAALEAARIWMQNLETSNTPRDLEKIVWSSIVLGDDALERGDLEEGNRLYTRVVDQRDTLLELAGDQQDLREILMLSYRGRARIYARAGEFQKASDDWNAAIALAEGTQRDLYVVERPILQVLSGAYDASASEVRTLLQQYPPDHLIHVVGAKVLVQAGKSAATDDSRSEDSRSEAAEALFLEAMQMLEIAHRLDVFQVPSTRVLLGDPDFDPLRARDDFKALLQAISSSGKSSGDVATPDATER